MSLGLAICLVKICFHFHGLQLSPLGPTSHLSGPRSKTRPSPRGPLVIGARHTGCFALFAMPYLSQVSIISVFSRSIIIRIRLLVRGKIFSSFLWQIPSGIGIDIGSNLCLLAIQTYLSRRRKTIDDKNGTIRANGDGGSLPLWCVCRVTLRRRRQIRRCVDASLG